jgi:hypothetical protein
VTIKRSTIALLLAVGAATAAAHWAFDASIAKAFVAVAVFVVLLRIGLTMISGLAQPVPEPPEPGTLRKVKLTFRCSICGAEVRMTAAASEEPEPPRHCLEDMELVAPVME